MTTYRPQRIKEARQAAGLTQRELAKRLDVSERTVARWEAGASASIRLLNLREVALVTGRPLAWLRGEDA